jgi:hypothetical protein
MTRCLALVDLRYQRAAYRLVIGRKEPSRQVCHARFFRQVVRHKKEA